MNYLHGNVFKQLPTGLGPQLAPSIYSVATSAYLSSRSLLAALPPGWAQGWVPQVASELVWEVLESVLAGAGVGVFPDVEAGLWSGFYRIWNAELVSDSHSYFKWTVVPT